MSSRLRNPNFAVGISLTVAAVAGDLALSACAGSFEDPTQIGACDIRKAGKGISNDSAQYEGPYVVELDSDKSNDTKRVTIVRLGSTAANPTLIRKLGIKDGDSYTNRDILIAPDGGTDTSGTTAGITWTVDYYKEGNGQKWIGTGVNATCPSGASGAYNF